MATKNDEDEQFTIYTKEKTRSASICFTGILDNDTTSSTPSSTSLPISFYPPRTPSRSQSVKISGKYCTKKSASSNELLKESENKCMEGSPPQIVRRRSATPRRAKSVYHQPQRKSVAHLEVPRDSSYDKEKEDEDSYRLRSFSFTTKGVVNRGDSFRRRQNKPNAEKSEEVEKNVQSIESKDDCVSKYNVSVLGAKGVGKTSLISQFMTSECINAYDKQKHAPTEQTVSIMLNGKESELRFHEHKSSKSSLSKRLEADAFVIIYSVGDKTTFQRAETELMRLQDNDLLSTKPAILVGNKVDLARARMVSSQDGKCLACTFRVKYSEISVGINHNVDELLVGILYQIRLKKEYEGQQEQSTQQWYKSRGLLRASMKARQMITWIFGREDTKFRNCENLHIL